MLNRTLTLEPAASSSARRSRSAPNVEASATSRRTRSKSGSASSGRTAAWPEGGSSDVAHARDDAVRSAGAELRDELGAEAPARAGDHDDGLRRLVRVAGGAWCDDDGGHEERATTFSSPCSRQLLEFPTRRLTDAHSRSSGRVLLPAVKRSLTPPQATQIAGAPLPPPRRFPADDASSPIPRAPGAPGARPFRRARPRRGRRGGRPGPARARARGADLAPRPRVLPPPPRTVPRRTARSRPRRRSRRRSRRRPRRGDHLRPRARPRRDPRGGLRVRARGRVHRAPQRGVGPASGVASDSDAEVRLSHLALRPLVSPETTPSARSSRRSSTPTSTIASPSPPTSCTRGGREGDRVSPRRGARRRRLAGTLRSCTRTIAATSSGWIIKPPAASAVRTRRRCDWAGTRRSRTTAAVRFYKTRRSSTRTRRRISAGTAGLPQEKERRIQGRDGGGGGTSGNGGGGGGGRTRRGEGPAEGADAFWQKNWMYIVPGMFILSNARSRGRRRRARARRAGPTIVERREAEKLPARDAHRDATRRAAF